MKKVICLFLVIVCLLAFTACEQASPGNLTGTTVTGKTIDYDIINEVLLMSAQSGEEYALVVESDSTITWENTDFFIKNDFPIPDEKDF